MKNKQITRMTALLGMSGFDGMAVIAALNGFFKPENIAVIALIFIAGPVALLTATMLEGSVKERVFVALISGLLATFVVMIAAGFGPMALNHFNVKVLKIAGGIAMFAIGFLFLGIKIPNKTPLIVIIFGLIGGILIK